MPLWQQAWFLELVKWAVVAVLALAILLLVVRPVMRRLLPPPVPVEAHSGKNGNGQDAAPALAGPGEPGIEGLLEDQVEISGALENGRHKVLPGQALEQLEQRMDLARTLVAEDPKRAVHVIKNWLTSEA